MDHYQQYLKSSLYFLKFRPRSEKEIRDNLKEKKASDEIIEQVVSWLKEKKFVNDFEFARMWAESRTKYKQKSKRIIQFELQQKGISKEIIMSVMQDDEVVVQNDLESAIKIVEKKIMKYEELPRYEIYQKLGSLLGRRGFDWEVSKKAIDAVLKGN
jgi:regulatory protein